MQRHLHPRVLGPLALSAAALAGAGCTATSSLPPRDGALPAGSPERLERRQPADIAIAPIDDRTESPEELVALLRGAFSEVLVDRLYSPLDTAYVDTNWVESSFRGTPAPDALLVVRLLRWNDDHLYSSGEVQAEAELVLFEGGSTTGSPLWGRRVRHTVDFSDGRGNPPAPSPHLIPRAARRFAREALRDLPERDPLAAHGQPAP